MADHLTPPQEAAALDDIILIVGGEIVEGSERRRVRFERREARLHKFRSRNLLTRALVRRKRNEDAQSREKVSTAIDKFINSIQNRDLDHERLVQMAQSLQVLREEHTRLEEEYMALEERLDTEEWEIMKLEKRIYRYHHSAGSADISDLSSQSSGTSSSSTVNSHSSVPATSNNPLFETYLSKLGDADLIREAHANLLQEHAYLEDSSNLRQRVGMVLAPDDLEILTAFPARQAQILKEFHEVKEEIKRLRRACIREGLLDDNESDADSEIGIEFEFDVISTPNISHHSSIAPPLLPVSPQDHPPSNFPLPQQLSRQDIARANNTRVSSWLLQKLRSSSSEVELLKRFSNSLGPIQDEKMWREKVISHWYVDGAGLPMNDLHHDSLHLPGPAVAEIFPPEDRQEENTLEDRPEDRLEERLEDKQEDREGQENILPDQQHLLDKIVDRTSVGIKMDFGLQLQSMRPEERRAMTV